MKTIIYLLIALPLLASCQIESVKKSHAYPFDRIITDSIVWHITDVHNVGDTNCSHAWIYSEKQLAEPERGCLVVHWGFHCSYDDGVRDRICEFCLRKESQRERWFQHGEMNQPTEYDILNGRLVKKND